MAQPRRAARIFRALRGMADRPWFLPAAAVPPFLDYVLPFLPGPSLLAALSVVAPRRWPGLAAAFTLASAAGAMAMGFAIGYLGQHITLPPEADAIVARVREHGWWALALLAAMPWPPRVAVTACAVAGVPPLNIGLAVLLGRAVPTAAIAATAARAPRLLARWRPFARLLAEVEDQEAARARQA
jgi:membrane protein YqaA with SNARE-associated domain